MSRPLQLGKSDKGTKQKNGRWDDSWKKFFHLPSNALAALLSKDRPCNPSWVCSNSSFAALVPVFCRPPRKKKKKKRTPRTWPSNTARWKLVGDVVPICVFPGLATCFLLRPTSRKSPETKCAASHFSVQSSAASAVDVQGLREHDKTCPNKKHLRTLNKGNSLFIHHNMDDRMGWVMSLVLPWLGWRWGTEQKRLYLVGSVGCYKTFPFHTKRPKLFPWLLLCCCCCFKVSILAMGYFPARQAGGGFSSFWDHPGKWNKWMN